MAMSGQFAASLSMLLVAAIMYLVAIGTNSWSVSGQELTLGLWKFCMDTEGNKQWTCLPNKTDFSLAAQVFSMLAVLCYAVSFLLFLAYIVFHSLGRSRTLTMSLCLLAFSIDHDDDRVRGEDGAAVPQGGERALPPPPGRPHHRLVLRLRHRLLHHRHRRRRLHLPRAPQHRHGGPQQRSRRDARLRTTPPKLELEKNGFVCHPSCLYCVDYDH